MSLRKPPTRTPAFLEAIRRNAQKSTGPWTVRGKAQSCLNRLKTGEHSKTSHAKAQRREGAKETIQLVSVEFRAFVPWRLGVRCLLFHTFEAGSAKKTKHLNLRAVERAK